MEREKPVFIEGKTTLLFSRGILAKKLEILGFSLPEGYEISIEISNELIKLNKSKVSLDLFEQIVYTILKEKYAENLANRYMLVEKWKTSDIPIWILVAGAIGVGKSTAARKIAGDLDIQHVIGTDVVRDILRKILSVDVMPELHSTSYNAYKSLRPIYSSRFDEVILGFENHAKYVNIGVEAALSRAEKESVSVVVEGEHLLPSFFDETVFQKKNVLYFTIAVPDPELHKENIRSQYTKEKEELLSNFEQIRKIHDHLVNETRIRKLPIINSERGKPPIMEIRKLVVDKITSLVSEQ
ncbi:MAG: hypothetical protein ACTSUR_08490 [Candidatus Heimdallarchaeaceae archaeon]